MLVRAELKIFAEFSARDQPLVRNEDGRTDV
jgi:hypothetical protein